MKNLKLLFGVCLGVLVLRGARGVDYDEVARAASRTSAQNVSSSTPSRGTNTIIQSQKSTGTSAGRTGGINARERTITAPATTESRSTTKNIATRSTTTNTTPRINATLAPRATGASATPRTARPTNTARAMTNSRNTSLTARSSSRITNARAGRSVSRAATTNESTVPDTNYTRCRTIYYECMDEFCANKDANLRRCACSSRANEFDTMKKNMSKFEDRMLNFNQRLLLVNLDAEDVNAINTATEGEDAFYATKDKTKSKKVLDEIAKKLNATFGDDSDGTSLAPISLSLNIDSAFDTVDSFMGADTTSKSGTALYNAAIPICRETAMEVCTENELSLAMSGYLMLMEQDCNTVFKAYQAQADTARSKVFESNALLDMSRLDAYQTRNSDDILTCKRKMMEMLTNTTVCGANMEKCLDMTGKYIDPTTGKAFLTPNLSDLGSLITRPDVNQSWTSANGVGKFINYLNNKKQFLTPAMENCQDIADRVWDAFIEDALAQIKLAQDAKLEEIRQACTTLTSECVTAAYNSIDEFDARALSVFGVSADRTANAMCTNVRNSCTALMGADGDTDWESGMSSIATVKTYDTIISSCTQVARNCIIQSCRSISGNFDLCDDIDFSPNRHAILERTACWPELLSCVAAAGDDAILNIMASLGKEPTDNFYADLKYRGYTHSSDLDDICVRDNHCTSASANAECATCRIAERIWGNCEAIPLDTLSDGTTTHNRIWMPFVKNDTILSWFAINTGTARSDGTVSDDRSCVNTRCTSGDYHTGYLGPNSQICLPDDGTANDYITDDNLYCPNPYHRMPVQNGLTNCCFDGAQYWNHTFMGNEDDNDAPGACCETGNVRTIPNTDKTMCLPPDATFKGVLRHKNGTPDDPDDDYYLVCVGTTIQITHGAAPTNPEDSDYPAGDSIQCVGSGARVILISNNDKYTTPSNTSINHNTPQMFYYNVDDDTHENPQLTTGTQSSWFIKYPD